MAIDDEVDVSAIEAPPEGTLENMCGTVQTSERLASSSSGQIPNDTGALLDVEGEKPFVAKPD